MKNTTFSRREALHLGAMTAAGLALPAVPAFAQENALITKPIPKSGEQLPVIGLGTNQYNVQPGEDLSAFQEVLETMADMGGSVIDTARVYGRSEEIIGELVQSMDARDRFFIVTKTSIGGPIADPDAEVQTAFDRLGVDVIDALLIHNLHALDELMPALIRAKEQGRVRYIGMSTSSDNQYDGQMDGMRRYPLDIIQVDYSIANRTAEEEMLPLAQELGLGVMINVPFGGRMGAGNTFGRVSDVELPDWAAEIGAESWAQVFLKYVVSHPAVTVAIPGTIQARYMADNQGAGRGVLPDAAMRQEIERFWDSLPA